MRKLVKSACLTDIHFGKKSNSPQHNNDCLAYLDWFCEQVRSDPSIDHVLFLGDWHEQRSAVNIQTLNYSYEGAKKLNSLGLPVYFCVGNHDLFHRHTRDVHSTVTFHEFNNFTVVNEPKIYKEIADGALLSPYLFPDEYPLLSEMLKIPFWAGHFEFKGFVITGYNVTMPTGPDPAEFKGPNHILCGHFHKRQTRDNITYIGNTFPMDFGDAGDTKRGMAVMDHISGVLSFIDWPDCPKYIKVPLSELLEDKTPDVLQSNARIKCMVDMPISYEESLYICQKFSDQFQLREFSMEDASDTNETLTDTQATNTEGIDSIDGLVLQMLTDIKSNHIDNNILIETYRKLKI